MGCGESRLAFNRWLVFLAGLVVFLLLLTFFLASLVGRPVALANRIAVIPIHGEISTQGSVQSLSVDELVQAIEDADSDPTVSAILMDIDSGGGSVVSSKQVVSSVRETEKPIVSYIGEVGASGAYYIASASDYIVSDADSVTGSVGVISFFPNLEGLMEKVGVRVKVLKEGEHKDLGSPFQSLSPEQEQIIQGLLREAFQHFREDVLQFRASTLDRDAFDAISDGRILSGTQAQSIGLVDELGTKKRALKKAAELAGISGEPIPVRYGAKAFSFLDFFLQSGKAFGQGFKQGLSASSVPTIQS